MRGPQKKFKGVRFHSAEVTALFQTEFHLRLEDACVTINPSLETLCGKPKPEILSISVEVLVRRDQPSGPFS